MQHYTYSHNKPDGTPFYIGKGVGKRAYSKRRNVYWKRVAEKYGYEVQILAYWKTNKEALDHEMLLISCFKDMGIELTNMTNGGEGLSGHKFSESHKKAIAEKLKVVNKGMVSTFKGKKHSEEAKLLIKQKRALQDPKSLSHPHSEETKAKLSLLKIGTKMSKESSIKKSIAMKAIWEKRKINHG